MDNAPLNKHVTLSQSKERSVLTLQTVLQVLRQHLPALQSKYPVARLAVFGSYARGEQTTESDIDVLVELSAPMGWDFIAMADEIESLFEIRTDVIPKHALSHRFLQSIEKDLIYI